MHISEGVLAAPVLLAGGAVSVAGCALGIKKLDYDKLPKVALCAAVFFLGSLIHLPLGPSSLHLTLNGLVGLLLGWTAFPAILVGLVLQAVMFQFGGLVVLGANTAIMALPAVACHYLAAPLLEKPQPVLRLLAGALAGGLAILGSAVLASTALWFSGESFATAAYALLLAHLPVMLVEAVFTAFVVGFLAKVRPAILHSDAY